MPRTTLRCPPHPSQSPALRSPLMPRRSGAPRSKGASTASSRRDARALGRNLALKIASLNSGHRRDDRDRRPCEPGQSGEANAQGQQLACSAVLRGEDRPRCWRCKFGGPAVVGSKTGSFASPPFDGFALVDFDYGCHHRFGRGGRATNVLPIHYRHEFEAVNVTFGAMMRESSCRR